FLTVVVRFLFQAEDGIRDFHVTGVQTCALPICERREGLEVLDAVHARAQLGEHCGLIAAAGADLETAIGRLRTGSSRHRRDDVRSEERRVGRETWTRRSPGAADNNTRQRLAPRR